MNMQNLQMYFTPGQTWSNLWKNRLVKLKLKVVLAVLVLLIVAV